MTIGAFGDCVAMKFPAGQGRFDQPAVPDHAVIARKCGESAFPGIGSHLQQRVARGGQTAAHQWRTRSIRIARRYLSCLRAMGWTFAMSDACDYRIDATGRIAEVLPDVAPERTQARLHPLTGRARWSQEARNGERLQIRGGLPADTVRCIRDYVERQLSNTITRRDLASLAGLSEFHFARAFKQTVGLPPHRYVMHRRVERAAMLIQRTSQPLSQIALEVGFFDQSHFSRSIARATGQTPLRLRRTSLQVPDGEIRHVVVIPIGQDYSSEHSGSRHRAD